jgi:transcriptional/translational regulatory protein YebC/TACO1
VEPEDVSNIAIKFKNLNYDIEEAETVWLALPDAQQQIDGSSEQAKKIHKILDDLEAVEDVTAVYSNATFES